MLCVFCAGALVIFVFYNFGRGLPDYRQLATYTPAVMTRVYAGDGRLISEYAVEGRVFVPINAIPEYVISAFVSAEDKTFYRHSGLDFIGIARAVLVNIEAQFVDRRMVGASTITQQVAKNFLLSSEYSFERKIKEAILALRIERAFTKDYILELYLNEIYLGFGSYGVAAAAMNYFNKPLDELSISEAAFLAGLPKGPNNYHPIRRPKAARERKNYVLNRMVEDNHISRKVARKARIEPIIVRKRDTTEFVSGGDFFAEDVRRELGSRFGGEMLYKGGLAVRTSLNPELQLLADQVLRQGLLGYDKRHGWRGPVARLPAGRGWSASADKITDLAGVPVGWELAIVEHVGTDEAAIIFRDGASGTIPLPEASWARKWMPEQKLGGLVTTLKQVLRAGDLILVENALEDGNGAQYPEGTYGLRQMPEINGALVAMDPHTGRVLAMAGGFSYDQSQYNRASQAERQPGSAFKPFVYLAALNNGYTPATLVLDAPFVIDQGPGLPKWKPRNYSGRYYGESTLRTGIEKSQNLMTVRLAKAVGMDKVASLAEEFEIVDDLPENLSSSLGSEETTLMKLTAAYAMLVNGGRSVEPTLIDRVQDRNGKTIYRHDSRNCLSCGNNIVQSENPPSLPDDREQVVEPTTAYQMVSMLEGVVKRGTARRLSAVGKPVAGKTGTSNDSFDTWFMGFSPDLVVGVFVGFDEPRTLGSRETGSSVASPIFGDFMKSALSDKPAIPFRIPAGIRLVRVNQSNGLPAKPGDKNIVLEAFKDGTVPQVRAAVIGSDLNSPTVRSRPDGRQPSAGGLY